MDHKPRKIVNDLRLISLETNLAYYKEDFVLSAFHKDRTDDNNLLFGTIEDVYGLVYFLDYLSFITYVS